MSKPKTPFLLATRSSPLALWQANTTARLLSAAWSDLAPEALHITSKGDADQESALSRFGRIGIFTVEVDRAVVDGRARCAVHSAKDMVTELQDEVMLSGVLARGPVEDVLISRRGETLDQLAEGSRVATGSLRRKAMLLAVRPDLQFVEMRGNVDTRLRKLEEGEADAMVLARAGLERLGLDAAISQVLPADQFLPAVSQGIVGLVCKRGDWDSHERVQAIRDMEAWHEALAERSFLRTLRGGCNVPVGARARAVENVISLTGRVLSVDGQTAIEGQVSGPRDSAETLGRALGEQLLSEGAAALIEAARA